ncbi:MAG TPA: DNA double-strand break repair nuclease NurA [Ktedonobacterales bacterium]|jgi:hypothetical protein
MAERDISFADLPAALVQEILDQTTTVSTSLLSTFEHLNVERETYRQDMLSHGLILQESSLGYPPLPTTCATDGSYGIERLLTADLVAAAAVAVEGLTPPSEQRFWEQPRHMTFVKAEVHHMETATVLRAVMLGYELMLATRAPHDLVMLDGTFTLPIIYFNQALNAAPNSQFLSCSQEFLEQSCTYLEAYASLLKSERSDKNFIALPKYSTRREIGHLMNWPGEHDDRGLLTLTLRAGELTRPIALEQPEQEWHLYVSQLPQDIRGRAQDLAREIPNLLKQVHVIYYKPHDWLPALRIELSASAATNAQRLASIIQGLKYQCATPGMLEPYPQYLADRTVKSTAKSLPAFRQFTTQQIAERYVGDVGEVFFAMHGYRSEAGG